MSGRRRIPDDEKVVPERGNLARRRRRGTVGHGGVRTLLRRRIVSDLSGNRRGAYGRGQTSLPDFLRRSNPKDVEATRFPESVLRENGTHDFGARRPERPVRISRGR